MLRPSFRSRRPRRPVRSTPRACEPLESRTLLTTTVYLDFGDAFPAGGMTGTAEELRDDINGPNFADGGNPGVNDDTGLTFTPFAQVVQNMGVDYDADGNVDGDDATALRNAVISLVTRYYAPFDVNVVVAAAADFDDIEDILDANGGDSSGEYDAYTIVAGVTGDTANIRAGLNGQASGDDIGNDNDNDDTCVAIVNNILAGLPANQADTQVGYTTAHEAAHTLSLEHTQRGSQGPPPDDTNLLSRSDLIVGSAFNTNRVNIDFFTRFDLATDSGSPATQNSYGELANDADIGPKAGFPAYVTGTGAFDKITLRNSGTPGMVRVEVEAHRDNTFSNLIASTSYDVSPANGILIEAGFSTDQVVINANINASVTVRGMNGSDQLILMGNGAASGGFAPGNATTVGFDDNTYLSGTVTAGATVVQIEEFQATGSVMLQDVGAVGYATTNVADVLTIDSPGAGQTRVAGTSGGVPLLPLTVQNVSGPLTVQTGAGVDAVTVNGNAGAGVFSLVVNTGSLGDTVTVNDTADQSTVTVNGGPAGDTITVNNTGSNSDLTVVGDDGGDTVAVNNTGTNSNTSVEGSVGGDVVNVNGTGAGSLVTVDGGTGTDTVFVVDTGASSTLHVNAGGDADEIYLFDTGAGSNTTVSGGDLADIIDVDGGGAGSTLLVNGDGGGDTIIVSDTGGGAGTLITVNGGTDNDFVNVTGTGTADSLTVNAGSGADRVNLTGAGLNAAGVFVNGDAGDDVVDLTSSAVSPIDVDGGPDNDTLKVNGETLTYAFTTAAGVTTFSTAGRQAVDSTAAELLDVRNGTFTVVNTVDPNVRVQGVEDGPATLDGTGTIAGTLLADPDGTVSPAVGSGASGILGAGSTTLNAGSTFFVDLSGIVAGTLHDQLRVTGTVTINGADLAGTLGAAYTSIPGDELVIIRNDGSDAVAGSKFAQGDLVEIGGRKFAIDYAFDGDGDGNLNDVALIRYGAELHPDPCDPTRTALFVSATTGDDNVLATPHTGSSRVNVTIEAVTQGFTDHFGPFDFDGQIIMMGQSGNDLVSTAAVPSRQVMLYGNVGDDRLVSGNNGGILLGNLGNDSLVGGNSRELLIGGSGADTLAGNNAGDILIAASTVYDTNTVANRQALCDILHEWEHGGRRSALLNVTTVHDDAEQDHLAGGHGVDWFIHDLNDILDQARNELASDL